MHPFPPISLTPRRPLVLRGRAGGRRRALLRFSLSALAAVALVAGSLAMPASAAADQPDPSLSKLEVKFFQHDYPKDTIEDRLERLEKMVFGEAHSGSNYERLQSLLSAVPNLSPKVEDEEDAGAGGSGPASPGSRPSGNYTAREEDDSDFHPPNSSQYPAVTAIERRLFGKDFVSEAIGTRLERLEMKVFGKVSDYEDLSERMDRLKQRTGIDVARQAPPGSDWADEEEDYTEEYHPVPPVARSDSYRSSDGADGMTFSGRNLRQDMQRAFGSRSGSGTYGMSGGAGIASPGSSGSYGMGSAPRSSTGGPPVAPPIARRGPAAPQPAPPRGATASPVPAMGLNQQVAALEMEIFGKTHTRDPLPERLKRLESTVFPQERPATDRSIPDRVNRLLSVIPLSPGRQVAQNSRPDNDFDDLGDLGDMGGPGGMGSMGSAPAPRASSGLGKIINSIGNMLMGGGMVGGYPMQGTLTTDPQTGLLYDAMTGNLIDPVTGVVVGQRMASPGLGGGLGSSFGSGFAPYGSAPFSFGFGSGSGMNFGLGRMGRYPGMWP